MHWWIVCCCRGNAIKWLAILIASILKRAPTVKIVELKGGDKRNALPRDAAAVLAIPEHHVEDAKVNSYILPPIDIVSENKRFLSNLEELSESNVLMLTWSPECPSDFT